MQPVAQRRPAPWHDSRWHAGTVAPSVSISPSTASDCRLGTLDDTPLFLGTAGAFVLIFGLVYLGLTV